MGLVGIVTGAAYLPTLRMYFLADDFGDVQLYSPPSFRTFVRLFAMDQSQGISGYLTQEFRPLVGLSYMVDYPLCDTNFLGYHLTAAVSLVAGCMAIFAIEDRGAAARHQVAAEGSVRLALFSV